jgi:hypothetical protein
MQHQEEEDEERVQEIIERGKNDLRWLKAKVRSSLFLSSIDKQHNSLFIIIIIYFFSGCSMD